MNLASGKDQSSLKAASAIKVSRLFDSKSSLRRAVRPRPAVSSLMMHSATATSQTEHHAGLRSWATTTLRWVSRLKAPTMNCKSLPIIFARRLTDSMPDRSTEKPLTQVDASSKPVHSVLALRVANVTAVATLLAHSLKAVEVHSVTDRGSMYVLAVQCRGFRSHPERQ